jgi:hypothetical protein
MTLLTRSARPGLRIRSVYLERRFRRQIQYTERLGRAVVVVAVVAVGCTQEPPEATEAAPAAGTADAEEMCRRVVAELDRRDEAGAIDWEAVEGPDEEPTEAELGSVTIDRVVVAADVVAEGERPSFPDFPERLDVAQLSGLDLVEAVDTCYEIGLLVDEDSEDEADDDEAG